MARKRLKTGLNEGENSPKSKKRRWPIIVLCVVLVLCLTAGGVVIWGKSYLDNTVLQPGMGAAGAIGMEYYTPHELQGDVLNILVVGVFREESDSYPVGLGLTDMILYVHYDIKSDKVSILQIPRDSYVGPVRGSDGKINSLMVTGEDKENPINNLVACISEQYKLPVDRYFIVDMEALQEIVDIFGGIRVYVPREMSYRGSKLEQGWQWLNGEATEFFVRNRHGAGFERADIDRLDNQRHFYSALFRRLLNMTPRDLYKLLPVVTYRCQTDINSDDVFSLAVRLLNLPAENIMFCKLPGATDEAGWFVDPGGSVTTMYAVDIYGRGTEQEPGAAALLNQYFRTYGQPVAASELKIPDRQIPANVGLYSPNIQFMSSVLDEEGGEVDVEPSFE